MAKEMLSSYNSLRHDAPPHSMSFVGWTIVELGSLDELGDTNKNQSLPPLEERGSFYICKIQERHGEQGFGGDLGDPMEVHWRF